MRYRTLLVIVPLIFLMACAGPNIAKTTSGPGLFGGLWDGFFMVPAFVISWFADTNIYEVKNAGGWYNLGFVCGSLGMIGGIIVGFSAGAAILAAIGSMLGAIAAAAASTYEGLRDGRPKRSSKR